MTIMVAFSGTGAAGAGPGRVGASSGHHGGEALRGGKDNGEALRQGKGLPHMTSAPKGRGE